MRDCPSCAYPFRSVKVAEYNKLSLVKYNLLGPVLSLCQCELCGMMYVDGGQVDQAWFDNYYLKFYKTDDKPFSNARLNALAECVDKYLPKNKNWILDIGGMDGELANRLDFYNIYSDVVGVENKDASGHDAVILSHTLEHIYDVPAMMERVKMALVPGGLLFIEVPIWLTDENSIYWSAPYAYDNHWQHINKFRPNDLGNILISSGFEIVLSQQIEDYREYNVWRIIGRMA